MISYLVFFACIVLILSLLTLGLNLQWGFTGLFNAGVVGFYAIGAYTHAILTASPQPQYLGNFGLPWLVGVLAAMAATALAGWLIGLVTIRLRGDYLAIATFGVAVSIQLVTLNWEPLTGGSQGLTRIGKPFAQLFETPFGFNLWFLGLMIVILGTTYWALDRVLLSPWGRVLKAIREDETAAVALGKSARRFRLEAFVLGSTLMGLAGALYVSFIGFVSPFDFLPIVTFQVWAMLIVGGSGNNRGALLGEDRRGAAADRLDGADHQEDRAGGGAGDRARQPGRGRQRLPRAVHPPGRPGTADGGRGRRQVPGRGRARAGLHRDHLLGSHGSDHLRGDCAVKGGADHLLLDREPLHARRTERRVFLPHHSHQQDPGLRHGVRDRPARHEEDRGHLHQHRLRHGYAAVLQGGGRQARGRRDRRSAVQRASTKLSGRAPPPA